MAMTSVEARRIGEAMANEYLKAQTVDAKVGIQNAMLAVANSLDLLLDRRMQYAFSATIANASNSRLQ